MIAACVLAVLTLAATACSASTEGDSADDAANAESGAGEPAVEPVDFDFIPLDAAAAACVQERTGMAPADAPAPEAETRVHLYYMVGVACRVTAGEDIPPIVRRSHLENSSALKIVSDCLVEQRSWTRSANPLDGIGGAEPASGGDVSMLATDLDYCGFHDPTVGEQMIYGG